MAEYKCGDCFYADLCEESEILDGFSRENPAYCCMFLNSSDVVKVRHGRWLCVDTDTEQFFLRNKCKKKEYWESNYCPNCGCRMDGGAD